MLDQSDMKINEGDNPIGLSPFSIFWIFLKLGLTSFGGPVAHLGYFRTAFVAQRGWFSEKDYADLVALCQFLPGPASSQVGLAIGYQKGGYGGALAAWLGFTMPSALALIAFGYGVISMEGSLNQGFLQGLKIVAVAVVAQAVWGMGQSLCTDWSTRLLAVASALAILLSGMIYMQFAVIIIGAIIGLIFYQKEQGVLPPITSGKGSGLFWIAIFFLLLFGLPYMAAGSDIGWLQQVDSFYRSGSLVFGGGHVVLPLLQFETVDTGLVTKDAFLAGYGATQAVPGPLFTFAAFLGTVMQDMPNGWIGGLICLAAIFLPSFLLVLGVLPYWDRLKGNTRIQGALKGVNAIVVGLLLAALITPVATSGLLTITHSIMALIALAMLTKIKLAPWLVVMFFASLGWFVL